MSEETTGSVTEILDKELADLMANYEIEDDDVRSIMKDFQDSAFSLGMKTQADRAAGDFPQVSDAVLTDTVPDDIYILDRQTFGDLMMVGAAQQENSVGENRSIWENTIDRATLYRLLLS